MTAVSLPAEQPHGHVEDPVVVGRRWRTGVLLLILADVAFVAALLFSYFYLRGLNTSHAWVAPKQQIASIGFGWVIAAIVVVSALAYHWGERGARNGARARRVAGAGLACLVVLAAAVAQLIQLASFPFGIGDSAYSSEMYTLGGANLFHLALTLFLGVGIWNRARLGLFGPADHPDDRQPQSVGLWWTWIAIAAVASAFVTSFVAAP